MNRENLAKLLHGRQYRSEITKEEESQAKENGLVIVFGASDDLMEFRGAMDDEVSAWDGVLAPINKYGIITNQCEDDCPYHAEQIEKALKIEAVWCPRDSEGKTYASWLMTAKIPHNTFDIMEDDDLYCRGMVFNMEDVR